MDGLSVGGLGWWSQAKDGDDRMLQQHAQGPARTSNWYVMQLYRRRGDWCPKYCDEINHKSKDTRNMKRGGVLLVPRL